MNCKCGIKLDALNMSDVDPELCQECVVPMLELIPEDPEVVNVPTERLEYVDRMIASHRWHYWDGMR